jgi:hypothetical protein
MPFQLSYGVPPECPNEAAFVEGVRARLPVGFEASLNDPAITIVVRVVRDGDGYSASIDVPAARGQRATRVVAGKSCENVVRGSALVTALALEARVSENAENTELAPPAPTPPTTLPRPSPAAPPTSARPRAGTAPPARPASVAAPFEFLAGARGSLATGVAPTPAFGLGVFVGVGYRALRVGLTLESTRSGPVRSEGVRADYGLDSARLEVGASLPLSSALELEGLASFEGGVLGAEAIPEPPTVVDGTRGSVAWLAPGAGLRLRVFGGPVFVASEIHGRVPLVQERFFVDVEGDRRVVYHVPYFSVGGALVVGARF